MNFVRLCFCLTILALTSKSFANINQHFDSIKSNPKALYQFLKAMPKGGELHYHLAGGAYPETMIKLASQGPFCLNAKTYTATKSANACPDHSMKQVIAKSHIFMNTLRAWSMMDFDPHQGESSHDHFFSSFYKFGSIVSDFRPQLLKDTMQRAANQNELYMEVLILPDDAQASSFAHKIKKQQTVQQKQQTLLADPQFKKNIHRTIAESDRILKQARHELGCEQNPAQKSCVLTMKFQYYILREQPFDQFLAQAISGFEAVSRSETLVAINLVQAENDPISMKDYQKQMAALNALHQLYPDVHIALHAGELTDDLAPKHALDHHIQEAIFTGCAERIGHGVSIQHEKNKLALLKHMAHADIPVEINLTSNEKILNVSGQNHPLPFYLNHQVPVVLSTDDEGILRTDLTREYVKASLRYNLDYPTLKTINRNALTYSFLPGKSLWKNALSGKRIAACHKLHSITCKQFIKTSPKARLQWKLEEQLATFENSIINPVEAHF